MKNAKSKLTDVEIKSFVNKAEKGKKLFDGGGLFIIIPPRGKPSWRVRYKWEGKEKVYSIGTYPKIGSAEARVVYAQVTDQVKKGIDPVTARKLNVLSNRESAENTFKSVADQWFDKMKSEWSATHYQKASRAIERDLYPQLGNLPIKSIDSYILSQAIASTVIKRGAIETADRILFHTSKIFNFAKGLKVYSGDNPVPGAREVAMKKTPSTQNMPALLEWEELGSILRKAKGANISPPIYLLHRLLAFTSVRIGTARLAEWSEFNLESTPPIWTIPRAKMKMKDRKLDHRIPLSPPIAQELKEWRSIELSKLLVFPSPQSVKSNQPISSDGLEKAYRVQLGLKDKHTPPRLALCILYTSKRGRLCP